MLLGSLSKVGAQNGALAGRGALLKEICSAASEHDLLITESLGVNPHGPRPKFAPRGGQRLGVGQWRALQHRARMAMADNPLPSPPPHLPPKCARGLCSWTRLRTEPETTPSQYPWVFLILAGDFGMASRHVVTARSSLRLLPRRWRCLPLIGLCCMDCIACLRPVHFHSLHRRCLHFLCPLEPHTLELLWRR